MLLANAKLKIQEMQTAIDVQQSRMLGFTLSDYGVHRKFEGYSVPRQEHAQAGSR